MTTFDPRDFQDHLKKLSRRNFLKLATMVGGSLVFSSSLDGCGPPCTSPNGACPTNTPGTPILSPTELQGAYSYLMALHNQPCYLFSSRDNGEGYRPCSWQFFYDHSDLKSGNVTTPLANSNHDYSSVLAASDVHNPGFSTEAVIEIDDSAAHGEAWPGVYNNGTGSYCHITPIGSYRDKEIYNLEYWTLFAFNKFAPLPTRDHKGDLICVQMVYNEYYGCITRIAFIIHGCIIQAFDLPVRRDPKRCPIEVIDGLDVTADPNAVTTHISVRKVPCRREYHEIDTSKLPEWEQALIGAGELLDYSSYEASDSDVYFAEGVDGYVHPCLFFEHGSHETWPNASGSLATAPSHSGGYYSFIPKDITLLDSNKTENRPFMYFGGHLGSSHGPVGLQLHNSWLNPEPPVLARARDDMDPYLSLGSFTWPPTPCLQVDQLLFPSLVTILAADQGKFYWVRHNSTELQYGTMMDGQSKYTGIADSNCTARLLAVDQGNFYWLDQNSARLYYGTIANGALTAIGTLDDQCTARLLAVDNGSFFWVNQDSTALCRGMIVDGKLQSTGNVDDNFTGRLLAVDRGDFYWVNRDSAALYYGTLVDGKLTSYGEVHSSFLSQVLAVDNSDFYWNESGRNLPYTVVVGGL